MSKTNMLKILDKEDCCGCNACGDICNRSAISFETDMEGFWYPKMDGAKCTDCGLCKNTCPVANAGNLKKNNFEKPITIAAIHKNMRIRWDSTSGGAFSAFAQTMYEQNGYVGGAVYNENFLVHSYISNNPDDLGKIRSSKYLQSNAEGLYAKIKNLLKGEEKVLVCGTPCQMAALRAFLGEDYEHLIVVDFICRGVNSPKVYRKYLDSLERKYGGKVVYVKAKNKELGWRNLTRKVVFDNGRAYYGVLMEDDFRRGYHTNVFCRPSCYQCQFKGFPRIADITLGDYWGIENIDRNLDNDIGTSMILLNSEKGKRYFERVECRLEFRYTPFESILDGNPALKKSIEPAKIDRKQFFEYLDKNTFEEAALKYFPPTKLKAKQQLKNILKYLFHLYRGIGLHPKSIWNFAWLNFIRKNTYASITKGNVIFPFRTVFDIHPTAKIEINAPFDFGRNPVKGLIMPTCLKMGANTSLVICDGPLTRYGKMPYNLRYGAYIEVLSGGKLTIGQGACNFNLTIMCGKEVTIGNGVRIGRNVSIRDLNGPHVIVDDNYVNHAPVRIGDHVWLCSGCTIMPGVTIGEGSVVAANALVTKSVPPRSLVAGIPAKVIKENIEWY